MVIQYELCIWLLREGCMTDDPGFSSESESTENLIEKLKNTWAFRQQHGTRLETESCINAVERELKKRKSFPPGFPTNL